MNPSMAIIPIDILAEPSSRGSEANFAPKFLIKNFWYYKHFKNFKIIILDFQKIKF